MSTATTRNIQQRTKKTNWRKTFFNDEKSTHKLSQKRKNQIARPNIIDVVSPILKDIKTAINFDTHFDNLTLAHRLDVFAKTYCTKQYNKIIMNPNTDNVNDLIVKLFECTFDNNWFFDIDNEQQSLIAHKPFYFEPHIHIVELCSLFKMPNTALKVGFAHLLTKMSFACEHDILSVGNITEKTIDNTHLQYIIELEESSKNDIKHQCAQANKTLKSYQNYSIMDIDVFNKYNPKCDTNKTLKNIIEKGLKLNFNITKAFPHHYDCEGLFLEQCFVMIYNNNNSLEQKYIDYNLNHGNWNGLVEPCNAIQIHKDNIETLVGKKAIETLKTVSDFFEELYNITH